MFFPHNAFYQLSMNVEDNFSVEDFLNITFDVMAKVADEFEQIKAEIDSKKHDNIGEKYFAYQTAFRRTISKYQSEMQTKYNTSIMEYNENAAIYKLKIEKYLENHLEESEKYKQIKNKLTIKPDQSPIEEESKTQKPSRYPFGIDKF